MQSKSTRESTRQFMEWALASTFNPYSSLELAALKKELLEKCQRIDDVLILYMIRLGVDNKRIARGYPKEITEMWNDLYTELSDLILQRTMEKGGIDVEAE